MRRLTPADVQRVDDVGIEIASEEFRVLDTSMRGQLTMQQFVDGLRQGEFRPLLLLLSPQSFQ